jgi:hypothetical protein
MTADRWRYNLLLAMLMSAKLPKQANVYPFLTCSFQPIAMKTFGAFTELGRCLQSVTGSRVRHHFFVAFERRASKGYCHMQFTGIIVDIGRVC